jgi:hypothetical protein
MKLPRKKRKTKQIVFRYLDHEGPVTNLRAYVYFPINKLLIFWFRMASNNTTAHGRSGI